MFGRGSTPLFEPQECGQFGRAMGRIGAGSILMAGMIWPGIERWVGLFVSVSTLIDMERIRKIEGQVWERQNRTVPGAVPKHTL